MSDKLEAYLEDIGHYLSGRAEREEILAEIRSHILEKAEQEHGDAAAASLEKVLSTYGPPRLVAEKYLDGRAVIAPAYNRYLFRYTALLFSAHLILTVFAVAFKESFVLFPFIFMPRLGIADALMYLPTAFLADLGLVALILTLITRSGKDVKLPWPRFAVDLDEVRPTKRSVKNIVGFVALLPVTAFGLSVFLKHGTLFFARFDLAAPKMLFAAGPGRRISLLVLGLLAVGTVGLFVKIFTASRWTNVAGDVAALVLISLLLRQPLEGVFAVPVPGKIIPKIELALVLTLLVIAANLAVDLVKNLVRLGWKKRRV